MLEGCCSPKVVFKNIAGGGGIGGSKGSNAGVALAGKKDFQIRAIVGTAWLAKLIKGDLEVAGLKVKRSTIELCVAIVPELAIGTELLATEP